LIAAPWVGSYARGPEPLVPHPSPLRHSGSSLSMPRTMLPSCDPGSGMDRRELIEEARHHAGRHSRVIEAHVLVGSVDVAVPRPATKARYWHLIASAHLPHRRRARHRYVADGSAAEDRFGGAGRRVEDRVVGPTPPGPLVLPGDDVDVGETGPLQVRLNGRYDGCGVLVGDDPNVQPSLGLSGRDRLDARPDKARPQALDMAWSTARVGRLAGRRSAGRR